MSNGLQIDMLAAGVVDAAGEPLAGGKVYTYSAGTTDDKATYTDAPMTTEAANPIILDAAGVANVYGYGNYKFAIYTSADVLVRTLDNQYYIVPSSATNTVTTVTADTSPTAVNQTIKCNTGSGNITVNLPTAVGNEGCRIVIIKTSASNTLTVDGYSSETINGSATQTLSSNNEAIEIISDNSNWVIINSNSAGTVTLTGSQTLDNKTLTTPVLASFYQDAGKTKLMTTPNTASDTLCAIAATQTLTNKTLTAPILGGSAVGSSFNLVQSAATAGAVLSGGANTTTGGRINLYGPSHATAANYMEYVGKHKFYDESGNAHRGIEVEAWTDVSSFGSGWSGTNISYMKDPMGFIHLKGYATNAGTGVQTLLTLGAGYRPSQALRFFNVLTTNYLETNYYIIGTDGTIKTQNVGLGDVPVAQTLLLDGIIFKAA